tara:strand:+ start:315 stop:737 length:423 start_codon:yes stop_codon:yes gene_type:complete
MSKLSEIEKILNDASIQSYYDNYAGNEALVIASNKNELKNDIFIFPYPEEEDDLTNLFQFTFNIKVDKKKFDEESFANNLLEYNKELPFGSFTIFDNEIICFKYIMICNRDNTIDQTILFEILTVLIYFMGKVENKFGTL